MNIFRRLGVLARSPTVFFERIEREPVSNSIYLYTIIILLSAVLTFPLSFWTAYGLEGVSFAAWFVGGIIQSALTLAQQVVGAVIFVLVVHSFAKLLRGDGKIGDTVKALLYPGALLNLVFLFFALILGIVMGGAFSVGGDAAIFGMAIAGMIFAFIALALMIWGLVLMVKGLKILHRLSTGKAIIAGVIMPILVVLVIGLIFGAALITLFGGV